MYAISSKHVESLEFGVTFNCSLASSAFSLSVDVSSPDLFGSIHEDFSLTSVSTMASTESKMHHVKGSGCGNQPKSREHQPMVMMATVATAVYSGTVLGYIKISVYLTLKKSVAGVT